MNFIIQQAEYKKRKCILLKFPYDSVLIEKVKSLSGAGWSASLGGWYVELSKENLTMLKNRFVGFNANELIKIENEIVESKNETKTPGETQLSGEAVAGIVQFTMYLRSRRYSENTISTYTDAVRTFLKFHSKKKMSEISNQDLIGFNTQYIIANKYSASFQNQVVNAVKLFFREMQNTSIDVNLIHRPRREHKLPNVLSKEEIKLLLAAPQNIKHKAMLSLIYACGLRCGELLRLKPEHVDSKRNVLIIKQSKGKKDRIAPLSARVVELLRSYYSAFRPKVFLFEGQKEGNMYDERSLQNVLKQNVIRAGIKKPVTLHWLRHSYATHLLENGTDLRYIQEILGHSSSKTTEIYTHVSTKSIQNIISPFDTL
ncbi:site-specific integrase [soil metagenome]